MNKPGLCSLTSSAQILTPSQESYHKHIASCFPHQIPTALPCNTCSAAQHPTRTAWTFTNQGKHRGPHKGSQCCHIPCVPPANRVDVISQVANGNKTGMKAADNAFGRTCTDMGICAARSCGLSRGQPACLFTGLENCYRKCSAEPQESPSPGQQSTRVLGLVGMQGPSPDCVLVLTSYLISVQYWRLVWQICWDQEFSYYPLLF